MPQPRPRRHRLESDRRRALELLAASRDGMSEALLVAQGITVPDMVDLVRAGLASVSPQRVVASGHTIEVATLRITAAGRGALDQ